MVAAGQVHPLTAGRSPAAEEPFGALAAARPTGHVLGLYVHVPFCAQRCHYCSFATAPLGDGAGVPRYLAALRRELALLRELPANRPPLRLATVFLGGGTPSLLEPEAVAALLADVRASFDLDPAAEVTMECNPESVTAARLRAYRAAGVNRISLGVQSLDDRLLAALGRLHSARRAREAFEAAREAGFDNVSVDLMYGLPDLSVDAWRRDAAAVLDWGPEHLSAYALTLDGGSPWAASGVAGLPAEEEVVAQYQALAAAAAARGFEHYEISNYARPGFRSRHNLNYWRRGEYLAAGPAACGFVGDLRYGNARATGRYAEALEAGRLPLETVERLTERQALGERLVLGLRTSDGVPAALLEARLEADPGLRRRFDTWLAEGLLVVAGGTARLTERGFLVSDALFVDLL